MNFLKVSLVGTFYSSCVCVCVFVSGQEYSVFFLSLEIERETKNKCGIKCQKLHKLTLKRHEGKTALGSLG